MGATLLSGLTSAAVAAVGFAAVSVAAPAVVVVVPGPLTIAGPFGLLLPVTPLVAACQVLVGTSSPSAKAGQLRMLLVIAIVVAAAVWAEQVRTGHGPWQAGVPLFGYRCTEPSRSEADASAVHAG